MKITISMDQSEKKELSERATRLLAPAAQLTPLLKSIHFLRGVGARSSFLSAALYAYIGSESGQGGTPMLPGYPGVTFRHYMRHTSFASLTLDCRKAFDSRPDGLTGAMFAKSKPECLEEHANYWSLRDGAIRDDAVASLSFLKKLFARLSRPRNDLLKGETDLEKRVGLLRCHADRSAAHLSLEDYAIHVTDLVHVVAALTFIGEIIQSFDQPWHEGSRFNELDEAGAAAARTMFPEMQPIRLFEHMDVVSHARQCWKKPEWGFDYITRQLPFATGWW